VDLKALYSVSYGLYVVGSKKGDRVNAQIANTVIQVCSDPPTISVCINQGNLTHGFIRESGVFSVSVLSQDAPLSFVGRFGFKSGRDLDKFEGIKYRTGKTGAPVVQENTLSYMEARVVGSLDISTHTIFVGELEDAGVLREGVPMTYAYYHEVKRGTTPKTAPSYVQEERKGGEAKLAKYKCSVCGYIYDPAKGDPDGSVPPGTPFEKLPDDWVCPVCGASKSEFEKVG